MRLLCYTIYDAPVLLIFELYSEYSNDRSFTTYIFHSLSIHRINIKKKNKKTLLQLSY